jgi:DNA-binding Lrp family transcriptional regulator
MTSSLKAQDGRIIRGLDTGLAIESRPFLQRAEELGLTEDEFLEGVCRLLVEGIIRRYGAVVRHRSIGYTSNVLVAWNVPDERINQFKTVIDVLDEVSHGYERTRYPEWNYNVYTMIHGHSEGECLATVKRIANALELSEYDLLFTKKELKKSKTQIAALLSRG